MSGNLITLVKWLPSTIVEYEGTFFSCKNLRIDCFCLIDEIIKLTDKVRATQHPKFSYSVISNHNLPVKDMDYISTSLENIVEKFTKCFKDLSVTKVHAPVSKKLKMIKQQLGQTKLQLCYILQKLICEISYLFVYYGDDLLTLTLGISTSYNNLLAMDLRFNLSKNTNSVCNNTCPYLLFPLRKFSVTRFLQILSYNRAEYCCHKLIDCLLETYKIYDSSDDDNNSDNSSLEIYMALTKHLSPPLKDEKRIVKKEKDDTINMDDSVSSFVNLEELMSFEESNVVNLLNKTQRIAPEMLGREGIKQTENGKCKISSKIVQKVLDYYEQILWAEVGNYLEHVVLWWACSPLSARPPRSSQHLREWIHHFVPTVDIPPVILSALTSLADALGVHVTSTLWDQCFRQALVASKTNCNPETGQLFCNVLQELVTLSNLCEVTPDWIIGAPLDELPLVEQIPVLHRLDHSIHTTRLWAIKECRKIANNWNVQAFFTITHTDIVNCLAQLNDLRLTDHSIEIEKGHMAVHVEVCTLMRAKLVSEVKINIQKLKDTPDECVACLASICKISNLAYLQMIFPPKSFWRTNGDAIPDTPCNYAEKYLAKILTPVLKAIENDTICNMVLTLVCESWLDHIYNNKIKFSQWGAYQLLCDFAYISIWIQDCLMITTHIKKRLLKNEVLRRCEGVGKLLLRCPGEKLKMVDKNMVKKTGKDASKNINKVPSYGFIKLRQSDPTPSWKNAIRRTNSEINLIIDENESDDGIQDQQMPAEMYVPNQEQWLELRAVRKNGDLNLFCC